MTFARLYDQLMADIDYQLIFNFIKPFIKDKKNIIDAGCGTGQLTKYLEKDHKVIGLDIDSNMLAIAQKRTKHTIYYIHDINDPMPIKTDAIISIFDVLNFNQHIKNILQSFYDALNNDGICIFDIYKEEVLEAYDNYHEKDSDPFLYQWDIQVDNHKIIHKLQAFDQTYYMNQFVHKLNDVFKYLDEVGFKYKMIDGPDERKHYIIAHK